VSRRARESGFTLVELVAAMVVLGVVAGFAAPLMLELSENAATQREARTRIWAADHAVERVASLLRAAPAGAPEGSGVTAAGADSFTLHNGTAVRLQGDALVLEAGAGSWPIAENVASFGVALYGRDGVSDASGDPLGAWCAEVTLDLGDGAIATRVSLARDEVEFIDFSSATVQGFGSQDNEGGRGTGYAVEEGGAALRITGNAWKWIDFEHDVTASTVLAFEYAGTLEPDIAGIQLATTMSVTPSRSVQVWGTQLWAGIRPPDVADYGGGGGFTAYEVRLRDLNPGFPLGAFDRLVFIQDDDAGPMGESVFRNVRLYEE